MFYITYVSVTFDRYVIYRGFPLSINIIQRLNDYQIIITIKKLHTCIYNRNRKVIFRWLYCFNIESRNIKKITVVKSEIFRSKKYIKNICEIKKKKIYKEVCKYPCVENTQVAVSCTYWLLYYNKLLNSFFIFKRYYIQSGYYILPWGTIKI